MPDSLKSLLIGALMAAIAFATAYLTFLNTGTIPTPLPSPSPSPTVITVPSPTPTVNTVSLIAMKGEGIGIQVVAKSLNLPAGAVPYEVKQVVTQVPSFQGARVGAYDDPLFSNPTLAVGTSYWVDLDTSVAGVFQVDVLGNPVQLKVISQAMPPKPSIPMYAEIQPQNLLAAHGLPSSSNVSVMGPLTQKYLALSRAHRIEPIKQNIDSSYPKVATGGQLDFTTFTSSQANFKNLVLDGAIAPPCIFGPLPTLPPTPAMLQAVDAAIASGQLPVDAWAYAWDEGEGDANASAQALARVQLIKQYAPHLKVMLTRQEDPAMLNWVDRFYPVMNWFKQPGRVQIYTKPFGLYGSCMAQGSCTNGSLGVATGAPMLVLDAPQMHFRAYPVVAYLLGASSILYYNETQMIATALNPGGQYFAGGNGDGTWVYPCAGNACPSLRMKKLRQGMNDIEWLILAKQKGITVPVLASSPFVWSKNESDYEAMRALVAQ